MIVSPGAIPVSFFRDIKNDCCKVFLYLMGGFFVMMMRRLMELK